MQLGLVTQVGYRRWLININKKGEEEKWLLIYRRDRELLSTIV